MWRWQGHTILGGLRCDKGMDSDIVERGRSWARHFIDLLVEVDLEQVTRLEPRKRRHHPQHPARNLHLPFPAASAAGANQPIRGQGKHSCAAGATMERAGMAGRGGSRPAGGIEAQNPVRG